MARLSSTIVMLLLSAVVALSGCSRGSSSRETRRIVCDGVWPQWVLDAAGWRGNGCVELPEGGFPAVQAPPNADWTPINTGLGLCQNGSLYIDGRCTVVPSDRPWPSSEPYLPWDP